MSYVIGVDLGTSGVKIILLNDKGKFLDGRSAQYSPDTPERGFVEQDPCVWWENTKKAIIELVLANPRAKDNVRALACSGQMHSSVFLDSSGEVIRPAILWNDTRTTAQTKEIYKLTGGEQNTVSYAYNRALEGFTLPKILWLRENEPENYSRVSKVIMPKDYLNYMLTGNIMTDVSDAAGTLLFDVKNRKWSSQMLEAVGVSPEILPQAVESTSAVGKLKPELAAELGLSPETLVIAGGADNSCAAIGNGAVSEGQAVISVGTSGTVIAFLSGITSKVTGDVHLFNYSYPGASYAMGVMLSAGECLNWAKRELFPELSFDEMNKLAQTVPAGSGGVVFLPYIFGERCPHQDADARGIFFGLSGATAKAALIRAVMEGVALGLKSIYELVEKFTNIKEIYITGGGAKSALWGQIISNAVNRELTVLNIEEGPAFGAALIAAVGSGVFENFDEAKNICLKVVKTIKPDSDSKVYEKYYKLYNKLYSANKELFKELSAL